MGLFYTRLSSNKEPVFCFFFRRRSHLHRPQTTFPFFSFFLSLISGMSPSVDSGHPGQGDGLCHQSSTGHTVRVVSGQLALKKKKKKKGGKKEKSPSPCVLRALPLTRRELQAAGLSSCSITLMGGVRPPYRNSRTRSLGGEGTGGGGREGKV